MRVESASVNPALQALLDEDPPVRLRASSLWILFWTELRDQCELHESQTCTLRFEHPRWTEVRVFYRSDSSERWLSVSYDEDLLYLRYKASDNPFTYELLVKVEGDDAWFQTRNQHAMSARFGDAYVPNTVGTTFGL